MVKKKQNNLVKWIIISVVTIVLITLFVVFKNSQSSMPTVSKEQAVAKVKTLPEVVDYLKKVPNGIISVNGEEDNAYLVQVYEFKNDHTATFNWYKVNKTTGEIEKQF